MPFVPRKAPGIADDDLEALASSVTDLALYVEDELEALASALGTDEEFNINYSEPTRPRKGLMVYADGTQWNPGNGAGFYFYSGSSWVPAWTTYTLPSQPSFVSVTYTPQTSALGSPAEGMVAYADGSSWDPGDGEGLYVYKNAAWRRLQDSAPVTGVTSLDSATGAITFSYGLSRSGQAISTSLASSTATLGGNVALNATGSYFDVLSLSLEAGTWFVTATALVNDSGATATIYVRFYDGTNTYASSATYSDNLVRGTAVTISAVITLASTTTVKLQARGPDSTTSRILFNQSGNSKDTHMNAVRIA